MTIQQLLELTIMRAASDLHLIVGFPPMLRLHGELVPVEGAPILTGPELEALLSTLFSPDQKQIYERMMELDFGFSYQGKARFRVNVYKQQGQIAAALRMIPMTIPPFESLGV